MARALGAASLTALGIFLSTALGSRAELAQAAPCDPPIQNAIVCENSKPGNPPSEWDVSGAGDPSIQGFATDISVDHGQTVHFKIDTNVDRLPPRHLPDGLLRRRRRPQGRDRHTLGDPAADPARLPRRTTTGLIDCGNWAVSASWAVPADAVSGIYFAKLVRDDQPPTEATSSSSSATTPATRTCSFRPPTPPGRPTTSYGGNSLYRATGGPGTNPDRAYKVSYNRPLTVRGGTPEDSPFNAEYPMVRWLERNGYDVSYFTGVDTDRRGAEILEHKTFLSVGHDEYWSGTQRANVEAARDAGVNLAFFSGNESLLEDALGDQHRTARAPTTAPWSATRRPTPTPRSTPDAANVWTGTWRDPRFSPPADGGRPENALTGTLFMVNAGTSAIKVPAADGKMRLWRNTSVASLAPGQTATLARRHARL